MALAETLVTLGGIILIVLILWHFFWSESERVRAIASGSGAQEIEVQVKDGPVGGADAPGIDPGPGEEP